MKLFIAAVLFMATTQPAVLPPTYPMPELNRRGEIVVPKDDPWITPCEASDFRDSPDYNLTMAWLQKLCDAAPKQLKIVSLGKSPEDRDIWMIVASAEGNFDPQSLRASGKPIFLAQAGIHPGEIDGKDAGMMLLRDMTVRGNQKQLLDRANFLFVPIFNIDGHERRSPYNRSNQRGPEITGWRTTSRNLNLNRDYTKLDTPEMRAIVRAINQWDPDLYYDIHVTDGADYQYDITFGSNGPHAHSPNGAACLKTMASAIDRDLEANGNVPGRLVFEKDPTSFEKGVRDQTFEPRYSHGYGDARHLPTVLVENHALKPYDRRVLGTYVLLESTLKHLGEQGKQVREAIAKDRQLAMKSVPLEFAENKDAPATMIDFKGVEFRVVPSSISGGVRTEWLGKPRIYHFPLVQTDKVVASVTRPREYIIPPAWSEVIERIKLHGIRTETITSPTQLDVAMYRLNDVKLATEPFEGHVGIASLSVSVEPRRETFPAGSVRVPTDQPLGDLAIMLLEPQSPDSFLRWGFFNEILQRTEYIDGYILEPMAERMMQDDPKLAAEFAKKLAEDKDFAASPQKRLEWFYSKTSYYDERWKLYPVARVE